MFYDVDLVISLLHNIYFASLIKALFLSINAKSIQFQSTHRI